MCIFFCIFAPKFAMYVYMRRVSTYVCAIFKSARQLPQGLKERQKDL